MGGGRKHGSRKFNVPVARQTRQRKTEDEEKVEDTLGVEPEVAGNLLGLDLLNIKEEKESSPKSSQEEDESKSATEPLHYLRSRPSENITHLKDERSAADDETNSSSAITDEAVNIVAGNLENQEHWASTESTLSTIDTAILWTNAEPESIPISQPKKRGRKPKAKNVVAETNTATTETLVPDTSAGQDNLWALVPFVKDIESCLDGAAESSIASADMRFPQSIINGIISIDMSSLCVNAKENVDMDTVVVSTTEDAPVEVQLGPKRKNKVGEKSDGAPKPKRGRPKRQKQEDSSSATSSPVKKPAVKRGRKVRDAAQIVPESGIWNAKKIADYAPEDYRKFEQGEVLTPEQLECFERSGIEIFHFNESEFNKSVENRQDGSSTWCTGPVNASNAGQAKLRTEMMQQFLYESPSGMRGIIPLPFF